MKWFSFNNLKYCFKSTNDLKEDVNGLIDITKKIIEKKEEYIKIKGEASEDNDVSEQISTCCQNLNSLYKEYDDLYPCVNHQIQKILEKKGLVFLKEVFYFDRTISLNEIANVIVNLGVKCKLYQDNQAVATYIEADEDFPEDVLIVVSIEDIWLRIHGYPLRCEIKNEEQIQQFLIDCNKFNCETRYFKAYIESDGQATVERQEMIESIRSSKELSEKLAFSIAAAYSFFKERKDFFKEVIALNNREE